MEWFEELKRIREALGLSQEKMAQRFDITVRTYTRWEKGEPKKAKTWALKLARAWLAEYKKRKRGA